jgi:putative hydrolase of the HAD superfamily
LGLAEHFKTIVVSCEIGAPKPSPLIFREATRRLCLPPAAILHVGDSPEADLAGAEAAGMKAVLLQRARLSVRSPNNRACITSLCELRF